MLIWVCGKEEEWDKIKLDKAINEATKSHRDDMNKDFDEAWMSQWASREWLRKLHLIAEILDNPIGEYEIPTCPKCGKPLVMREYRFGQAQWAIRNFYGCQDYPRCDGKLTLKQAEKSNTVKIQYKKGIIMGKANYAYDIVHEDLAKQ